MKIQEAEEREIISESNDEFPVYKMSEDTVPAVVDFYQDTYRGLASGKTNSSLLSYFMKEVMK